MDPAFKFHFAEPENLGVNGSIIQLKNVSFGYDPKKPLFTEVSMDITTQSRIVVLGPNGIGKSTLLHCIHGDIKPSVGEVYRHRNLKIGYFAQYFVDQLDLSVSPLEHLQKLFPTEREEHLRGQLGSFGIVQKLQTQKIGALSGGQKSRVIFATQTFSKPQILLLDEPTNHLDMNSVDALVGALMDYEGGVVVISHDQYLIQSLDPELWVISKGKITKCEDTFEDYLESMIARLKL